MNYICSTIFVVLIHAKTDTKKISVRRTKLREDKTYYEAGRSMLMDTGIKTKIIKQYLPIMNKLINSLKNGGLDKKKTKNLIHNEYSIYFHRTNYLYDA